MGQQGVELFDSSVAEFEVKVFRPRRLRPGVALGELDQVAHGAILLWASVKSLGRRIRLYDSLAAHGRLYLVE